MLDLYNPSLFLSPKFAGPYSISDNVSPSAYSKKSYNTRLKSSVNKITYPNGKSVWFHINKLKAYGSQNNHSTPRYDYTLAPGPTPSDSEHDSSDPFEITHIKAPDPDPPPNDYRLNPSSSNLDTNYWHRDNSFRLIRNDEMNPNSPQAVLARLLQSRVWQPGEDDDLESDSVRYRAMKCPHDGKKEPMEIYGVLSDGICTILL
ncbi:uncharacterized protein LOC119967686 [Scyliorhinus canicula]|uniref:uncharacterized protein LOC119967686 n=1 Tax=Scyliorhinus canicula TaxID=7830 RepID=UPI0018F3DA46|nr:uncharacterized protein LOC119967686 [Scyliorhinus canicula]